MIQSIPPRRSTQILILAPQSHVEAGLEDIEDALRHVRDPAKIHLCFMEEKETIQFSSQLMHLVPGSRDYLFANSRRPWASRYVLAKFSKSLGNQSIPWAGGQGWEIEDTLVYLSGIAANIGITLQQDGGQHNHEIFVDISTMRTYLLI